jgi:excisionase family DNA binding protein
VVDTATEELLSPQEAGERLGVSVYTVRRWIKEGKLRAFRPGKEYRVREADLEEFFRAREVRPKVEAQPEAAAQTVEEFERTLAHVLEPARTEALREWQASNRLLSSQGKALTRIVDPPEAAVAKRFVEEFSPEERSLAFAEVAVGHARHERQAEALGNNMAALRKEYLAKLKKKDLRIAELEAKLERLEQEIAQLKEGDKRMRQEPAQ